MPTLKTDRGTVLYAHVVFDGPTGPGQSITLPVFNLALAGIKETSFLTEAGESVFGGVVGELDQATAKSCTLVISNPDGSFASSPAITFGTTVVIGWSDQLLALYGTPADPDWRKNPVYITIDQHATISGHGAAGPTSGGTPPPAPGKPQAAKRAPAKR